MVFLVEHHLTMSQVAQKQDLSDPDVIAAFAEVVKDERHLTALYLLTVADIRGTSPKVWNAWKGKLLEDLYRITLRVLGGEPHIGRPRAEEPPGGSAGHAAPVRPAGRRARSAVAAARRGLFPAPRRLRHRLADARAVRPARQRAAGRQMPPGADRRRLAGGRLHRATSPTCSRASAAISTARTSASSTPRSTPRATAMRSTPSWSPSRTSPRATATSSA